MTREEKEKAINALKVSVPVYATTQEEFIDYRQTLNKVMDWLEQEPTTKNDLGVDCVSRKAVINQIFYSTDNNGDVVLGSALRERIARLPSVTPQEPKTGHWIDSSNGWMCSECNKDNTFDTNYCPNCGAKMVEPQESEEQE